jgi:hypothetical protein
VNDLPPRDRQATGTGSGRLAERCLPEGLLRPLGSWGGLAHRPLAPGWENRPWVERVEERQRIEKHALVKRSQGLAHRLPSWRA